MKNNSKTKMTNLTKLPKGLSLLAVSLLIFGFVLVGWHSRTASAQTRKLTFPEIITALNTKLPNKAFSNKTDLIDWLIAQIEKRKVDKPLTDDREDDLRQSGATDELIETIRANAPGMQKPLPNPEPDADSFPEDAATYTSRGLDYDVKGEYDLAVADLTKAIQLAPSAIAYNNRGNAYNHQGKYDLAIADYNKAIQLDPKFVEGYHNRGVAYENQRKYDLAMANYSKAIELNPKYVSAYIGRGNAFIAQGKYDLAIAALNKAIQLSPDNADAYHNRGVCYENLVKYELALADYNKAIKLNPDFASPYFGRGNIYFAEENYNLAIESYTEALQIKPQYAEVYAARALAQCLLGNKGRAYEDERKVVELGGQLLKKCE